jgi:hypothetical protein
MTATIAVLDHNLMVIHVSLLFVNTYDVQDFKIFAIFTYLAYALCDVC